MYRYYLAHRFMVSRPINLLGILGVMLGVWSLIVVVSIFDGYREELRNQFTMTSSDLSIRRLGSRADFERVREVVENDANVAACSPRLVWSGMIHPRDENQLRTWLPGAIEKNGRFVTVTGIDPRFESKTTELADWISGVDNQSLRVDLEALRPGANWILVSSRKAKAKNLKVGDDLKITTARIHYHRGSQTTNFLAAEFKVAGGYKTRHSGFDNLVVLVSIDQLRDLISSSNSGFVNEVAVKLRSTKPAALEQTRQRVFDALRALPEYLHEPAIVRIAGEQERGFMMAIAHQGGLMKLILFVIMIVAGFLVYATLSMMVTEKTHDIGVLSALGGTKIGVMQVFLTSGFAISLVGTALGVGTGCLTSIYLNDFNEFMKASFGIDLFPSDIYNLPGVPYDLDPKWIGIVVSSSLILGLVVSALPAWRAMSNDPLECLRDK